MSAVASLGRTGALLPLNTATAITNTLASFTQAAVQRIGVCDPRRGGVPKPPCQPKTLPLPRKRTTFWNTAPLPQHTTQVHFQAPTKQNNQNKLGPGIMLSGSRCTSDVCGLPCGSSLGSPIPRLAGEEQNPVEPEAAHHTMHEP